MGGHRSLVPSHQSAAYSTKVLLVRHGRSEFNVEGRVQGGGKLDLVGRAQASGLAFRFQREPVAAIYASPTVRTLQTANAIARHLGLPVHRTKLLVDIDFGVYANMFAVEARAKDPDLWERWRTAPHAVRFPQGESLGDLRRRMERFLNEARAWDGGRTILVVTHDSPIRVAACIAAGLDDAHHHQWVAGTASVTTIELLTEGMRLVRPYADTSHLQGIDAA